MQPLGGLIGRGVGDVGFVELLGDAPLPQPLGVPLKHLPHDLRRRRVRHQSMFVLRVLGVAIRGKGPDELPPPPLHVQRAAHVGGGLGGIPIVQDPVDGDLQSPLHRVGV